MKLFLYKKIQTKQPTPTNQEQILYNPRAGKQKRSRVSSILNMPAIAGSLLNEQFSCNMDLIARDQGKKSFLATPGNLFLRQHEDNSSAHLRNPLIPLLYPVSSTCQSPVPHKPVNLKCQTNPGKKLCFKVEIKFPSWLVFFLGGGLFI